jgi:hypothetical protein
LGACLAPAHSDDDFEAICSGDYDLVVGAFRHDFAIAFNGDTFAGKTKLGNKCGLAL